MKLRIVFVNGRELVFHKFLESTYKEFTRNVNDRVSFINFNGDSPAGLQVSQIAFWEAEQE
ncbi:hypothetical protein [Pseudanabaena sp. PCC 6802]|uniref:hypothetical protein n=1 Tax=Pseudanabaena sp. PCC 6802 TaxID=118173 RepID=UPI00037BB01F|nr:hypothetical protein [Pseudanabaena sp. PCC 6802]